MKKIITNLTLLCCMMMTVVHTYAQDRYVQEVFSDVTVTPDVTYGVNATVLFVPQFGEAIPQELKMDIYTPDGDTQAERPLVLVFHTGNYLPSLLNAQIAGTRTDSSAVEICTQLARRGFVAASVDYRLGWNPGAASQPERALGLIQAAYRGVQDGRTAIRFFKNSVLADGNPYGIDDSKITLWGNGTGGYLTLGCAGLSDYNEIINTANPAGKFLLDLDGDGVPETPMIVPAYHGDIEGKVLAVTPDDAFGLPAGDTTNYVNFPDISSDFNLTVNVGGALGDATWLDDQTVPIISVQSIDDMFAPYGEGILIVPTTGDPIVQVAGLSVIAGIQEANGLNQAWKDLALTDAVTTEAMANAATAGHPYSEGSYSWKSPNNSSGFDEGVVINWWDADGIITTPGGCMGLTWSQCPHPTDMTGATSYHAQGLTLNENMSAEKARGNISKIMDYVIPRACATLGLECPPFTTSTNEVVLDPALVALVPNPTAGELVISVEGSEMINTVELYSIDGRLISTINNVNQQRQDINLSGQTTGMYVVKVYLEEGVVAKKVMLK